MVVRTGADNTSAQQLQHRKATSILVAFFVVVTAHAYLDENDPLLAGLALIGAMLWWWKNKRIAAAAPAALIAGGAAILGSSAAPLLLFFVQCGLGKARQGIATAIALVLAGHAYHPLVAILSESAQPTLATLVGISFASLPLAVLFISERAWRAMMVLVCLFAVENAFLLIALAGEWATPVIFHGGSYRALLASIPAVAGAWCSPVDVRELRFSYRFLVAAAVLLGAPILLLPRLLPNDPIKRIVFDESHGDWATTLKPYGPADFGRDHSYTYSLLSEYARRLVPNTAVYKEGALTLEESDLFVMKMPTTKPSAEFASDLKRWVRTGGRLLVVLDHTDLFDTTQIANPLLIDVAGIAVAARAVFAADGRPNSIGPAIGKPLRGHTIGVMQRFKFLTGTSFASIPLGYFPLGTHGPSYSEPAEYHRPNRFGYFQSDPLTPYANHLAALATTSGEGLVLVFTDSTQWSNFVLFNGAYRDAFRNLVGVLERKVALRAFVLALLASLLVMGALLLLDSASLVLVGCLAVGATVGASIAASQDAWRPAKVDRDFNLHVTVGRSAATEALSQLVLPGINNYARLLSGLQKFGAVPRLESGRAPAALTRSSTPVLLLEPAFDDLPNPDALLERVHEGARVAIFFGSGQVGMPGLQEWLERLRLRLSPVKSLARVEAPEARLEERQLPTLARHMVFRITPLPESRLWEQDHDALTQSFAVRPIQQNISRPLGSLVISFQAEQFSDNSIGDIWEGKQTTELARDRERRLAILLGYEAGVARRQLHSKTTPIPIVLPHYTVLRDGGVLAEGTLPAEYVPQSEQPALGADPDGYVADLQRKAIAFIRGHCLGSNGCERSLIGDDLVEWHVEFRAAKDGFTAIELIHDRRFAGLTASYHVVFTSRK